MKYTRFDMSEPARNMLPILKPLATLIAEPGFNKHKTQVTCIGTENLKAPFIVLCNHNAFQDFKTAYHLLKGYRTNFVVAIDGFLNREWLLRDVGCLCKRKFTNDITLIRNLRKSVKAGNVPVIYPEARYSLCGTPSKLPESLGKLCKLLNVPVVTLICHGHHVNSPFWDTSHDRGVSPVTADYKLLFSTEQLQTATPEEINEALANAFQYDDFAWQKEHNVIINEKNRADGLQKVLYKCPHCGNEHHMTWGEDGLLTCTACNQSWRFTELGQIEKVNVTEGFDTVSDWYEWERACVRKEVEDGTYSSGKLPITIKSLPKDKFIDFGEGEMIHDINGFHAYTLQDSGDTNEIVIPSKTQESVHIEYRYLFKYGDCVDLNTLQDTWYCFPHDAEFNVTKMALATEEMYDYFNKK